MSTDLIERIRRLIVDGGMSAPASRVPLASTPTPCAT
jgi:hypothetical protein